MADLYGLRHVAVVAFASVLLGVSLGGVLWVPTSGLEHDVYSSRIGTMTTPKPPVSIRMPDDLLEEIKQVAADNERSVSSQIVFMLKAAMVLERRKQTAREMNYASFPRKRDQRNKEEK